MLTTAIASLAMSTPSPELSMVVVQPPREESRPARVTARDDDPWGVRDGRFGPRRGDWEFTLGGSGVSDHDLSSATYSLNVTLGHFMTDELELAFRQSLDFTDVGGSDFRGTSRVALDYHFGEGRFRPFVGGSFGGIYGDRGDSWLIGPEAGVKWFVHPQTFIMGMAEYQVFFDRARNLDDDVRRGDFVFSLGIGFLF